MEYKRYGMLVVFMLMTLALQAQDGAKLLGKADNYFKIKNYSEALKLYLEAKDAGENTAEVNYKIGKCYKESHLIDERIKGIPYFEKAIALNIAPLPYRFNVELGDVYLEDGQIDQAKKAYEAYKKSLGSKATNEIKKVDLKLKICSNAERLMQAPVDVKIVKMGNNINTEYVEYNPVVSADESVLAFTALRAKEGKSTRSGELQEEIFISYNSSGNWGLPVKVDINRPGNIGTAGISADGEQMIIYIGSGNGVGGLYSIRKEKGVWSKPVTFGTKVNGSRSMEATASLTPDGNTLYFSSNRNDTYGGFDIYKSELGANGQWGTPVNLGPKVNSKFDEDAPFIHPDSKTLFFTSNGEESMGGYDIFKTELVNDEWTQPVNLGYPINTTANDNYFNLTADGTRGYFSSDRKGGRGGQDIYALDMPEYFGTIPLTMIKGRILDNDTKEPIPTKIYFIDNATNKKLDYVYQPNSETGNYLIILPPNKSYDMVIESEGFLPYTLNIDIPNQTYFHELYQKIFLKTIKQFDVVVGQEVIVKNAFYDTNKDRVQSEKMSRDAAIVQDENVDIYELMNDMIATEDQEGVEYLTNLLLMTNPIDNVDFDDSSNDQVQAAKRTYYYDESDESKFEKKVVGDTEIYSLPTMFVTKEAEQQRQGRGSIPRNYNPNLLKKTIKIYFSSGKSEMESKYAQELDEFLNVLKYNDVLGIEISGYASSEGDEDFNRELSNKRAIEILNYLNTRGVVRRRIIAKGYGSTENDSGNAAENRRVEVKIVDLYDVD